MTNEDKIIEKELSYKLTGLFFEVHNKLGRYCREANYAEALMQLLEKNFLKFEREKVLKVNGLGKNRVDFLIDNRVLVDIKAKPFVERTDYYQMRRYLEAINLPLGIIVNFRQKLLSPKRVLNPNSNL